MKTRALPVLSIIGLAGLMVSAATLSVDGDPIAPNALVGIDIAISAVATSISGISPSISVSTAGAAAGMFSLALGTTSCNVGSVYIPFQAAMQYNHPYIVQNVYRTTSDGRLEQLSASWIKHAFSSASTSQAAVQGRNGQPACGTGVCDGVGGSLMGFNCSDTYGPGLNSGTYYLGPRSEVKPNDVGFQANGSPPPGRTWLGWNPTGSFFDSYTSSGSTDVLVAGAARNDSQRSYTTGATNQPFKTNYLRLDEVKTGAGNALGHTGRLFFESYYVCNGDVSKFNNHAWRRFRFNNPAGTAMPTTANFIMDGPHNFGPVVLGWGDQQQLAQPNTEGSVYLASRVVALPNNLWRYEYNVYNMDFDRQVGKIEIPTPGVASKQNLTFRQPRSHTPGVNMQLPLDTADWSMSYDAARQLMVFAPTEVPRGTTGLPTIRNLNTVRWGTMFTFHFVSDLPPRTNGVATIYGSPDRPGTTTMAARVSVPKPISDVGSSMGTSTPDGYVTAEDLDVYIGAFIAQEPLADVVTSTGTIGRDGVVDDLDFNAFISSFIASN